MYRVVVVGGGVSGLAVAHELKRRGAEVLCFEAGHSPGGSVQTERSGGFLLESGPTGFRRGIPAMRKLIRQLDLAPSRIGADPSASAYHVFREGKLRRLPRSAKQFISGDLLPPVARLRLLAEPLARARATGDESIEAFLTRRLGRHAGSLLADTLTIAICAGDSRKMSMRSSLPRLRAMESDHGSLFRALRVASPAGNRAALGSFSDGMAELTRALADKLGDTLRTGIGVCSVSGMGERGFRILPEEGEPLDADVVVLACPAADAAAVVGDWDAELARALESIRADRVARVHLGYREATAPGWPDGAGFVVPRGQGLRMLGTAWASSVFPGRAPAGSRLATVTFGGSRDPGAVGLDDETLVKTAKAELGQALDLVADPYLTRVVRPAAGIPQYELGHADALKRIDRRLALQPGLHVSGCSYRGLELSACIDEATRIAETVVRQMELRPVAVC